MEKIDTFIEEQRQQGEHDSEGSFTLDSLGALRKTLASALPEPHFYLLQIAQALIAGGATNIEVAIGRQVTRFAFVDNQGVFTDLQTAQARLGQGLTLSSSRPLDLLLTGMATSVGSEMDRADLSPAGSARSLQISLDQAHLVEGAASDRPSSAVLTLHRSVSMGLSFAWTRVWGARGEEGELQRRFEFASPPLKIAGLATFPGSHWLKEVRPWSDDGSVLLLEAALLDSETPNHRAPRIPDDGAVRSLARRAFTSTGEALDLEAGSPQWDEGRRWTFYATSNSRSYAEVWWIRNGVTLERTNVEIGLPGLWILAPAEGLDVDASGYAIVRNDKFEARLKQAAELARRALAGWSDEQKGQPSADDQARLPAWTST